MKKTLIAVLAVAGLALSGGAYAKDWKKVIVATEGAYPPFNYTDKDGNLGGFDVDFAKALCAEAAVECDIVAQDWDGMIPGLLARKYDAIIAQMSITEERKMSIDFTDYYSKMPAIFVAKDGTKIEAYKDGKVVEGSLDGMVIGAQRSTTHSNFLEDNFPDVEIKLYDTQDNANLDLVAGRIDATLADAAVLLDWLATDDAKGYAVASDMFAPAEWFGAGEGIGIRKEDEDLKTLLNAALARMVEKGTFAELNKQHFPNINLRP